MNVLPVCFFEDAVEGIYEKDGHIAIISKYVCDVYANALENFHQKQHHMKILSCLCVVRTKYILFYAV